MGNIKSFYLMPHPPIVIPEVSNGEYKKIIDTFNSCNAIGEQIKEIAPDTIIIITPHGPVFSDAVAISYGDTISGNLGKFGAREVNFNLSIDQELNDSISNNSKKHDVQLAKITNNTALQYGIRYELDHGSMVPLYFVNDKYSNYKLVHITYGMINKLDLYRFGMAINEAVTESNKSVVVITSGDLSHRLIKDGPYEYSPYGEVFDNELVTLLKAGSVIDIFNMDKKTVTEAGECGLRSVYIMLGMMNGNEIKGNLLSYEKTFGVGYAVMDFNFSPTSVNIYDELIGKSKELFNKKISNENIYVKLARDSLTHFIKTGEYMEMPDYVTDEMKTNQNGVFVSIKQDSHLRGCIGTILPVTDNVATEIIRNAVSAAVNDPRFNRIEQKELETLDVSVDILTEPVDATIEELNPYEFGVIVSCDSRSGVLLPDLEGVNTVDEQLSIVLQKAGINENEDYNIKKFKVIRYTGDSDVS